MCRLSIMLEVRLERTEILCIGSLDCDAHERRQYRRESRRVAAVAEAHASRAVRGVLPGICRFHGEWCLRRSHHEPCCRYELGDFICICDSSSEKMRHE